ncbi:secreted RxLR effector protein 161-like [Andrographis paniculata]|uniref:secreted RxLR effector protein 161-like n=1 Tax=Andrographis paniculata TaxID=175694 RepID=UPI0021E80179|nr:secreted RxLR effector protein 161-like [Andrographis paniculata]
MAQNKKLRKDDGTEKVLSSTYRSLIGSLLYLTATRPDILFATSFLSRFLQEPSQIHFAAASRILRYLKGTLDYGLMYKSSLHSDLVSYCDSDWAGSLDDRKSTSGCVFQLGANTCSWISKKQKVVATSTAQEEYIKAYKAITQIMWLGEFLKMLG